MSFIGNDPWASNAAERGVGLERNGIAVSQDKAVAKPGDFLMTQRAIPYMQLRGGSSKGLYFKASDLPADPAGFARETYRPVAKLVSRALQLSPTNQWLPQNDKSQM